MIDPVTPLFVKWLTHDLATPIATVLTASELLSDQPDVEINGLVQEAAARLANRLKLIRAAFAPGAAPMSSAALAKLVQAGIDGVGLDWQRTPTDVDGPTAAVIAGATMLLGDVRRGQPLTVTDSGVHCATPAALSESVTASLGGAAPVDSRSSLAAMLIAAATKAGMHIEMTGNGLRWR
jgi:hypothetical protein